MPVVSSLTRVPGGGVDVRAGTPVVRVALVRHVTARVAVVRVVEAVTATLVLPPDRVDARPTLVTVVRLRRLTGVTLVSDAAVAAGVVEVVAARTVMPVDGLGPRLTAAGVAAAVAAPLLAPGAAAGAAVAGSGAAAGAAVAAAGIDEARESLPVDLAVFPALGVSVILVASRALLLATLLVATRLLMMILICVRDSLAEQHDTA